MIIGREYESELLQSLLTREESQFAVVYGRRRVGKTYLIRETFNYQFTFQHTGLAETGKNGQLASFRDSLRAQGLPKCATPKSWREAFGLLKELISSAPAGKKIIFIDELPWMDTPKSNMISALENFWNGWATARPEKDIVLIVCGSATSWITKKLLKNKKGLRGRITEKIKLNPFSLAECESFATAANLGMERRDILETYMILGGIPYYWSFLSRGKSVCQNIDALFFAENAKLSDEFEALYSTLFKRPENYLSVISSLNKRKAGLTREEILKETGLSDGGTFTTILEELEQCDFIRRYVSIDKQKEGCIFQLMDNFTLFYYHCIRKNAFSDEHYWSNTYLSGEHNAWCGLAFERVCLQHVTNLKQALGITGIITNVCSWQTPKTDSHPGAQIDLLFKRADNVINLFEMKYSDGVFTIDSKYAKEIQNKISTFKQVTHTRCAIHPVMVTTYGVAQNGNRNILQNDLTMDELFGKRNR